MCKPSELKRGQQLINSEIPPAKSTLFLRNSARDLASSLKRALLEAVVSGLVETVQTARDYLECTLLAAEYKIDCDTWKELLEDAIDSCFKYLCDNNFTEQSGNSFSGTQLGSAALASSLDPDAALSVYEDLRRATRNLCLQNELHLVYLVTPIYMQDSWGQDFSWSAFYSVWCDLRDDEKHVGDLVGINEAYLVGQAHSTSGNFLLSKKKSEKDNRQRAVHMRFYTALALYDLINEMPLGEAAHKYRCSRGFVQSLQQQASTYAGMIVAFCERLGWYNLHSLLTGFAERLVFGVRRDLTELVQIDGLDGSRARAFHQAGFKTVASLANVQLTEIIRVLRKAVPFHKAADRKWNKTCWLANHRDMTEQQAAELIQNRAKDVVRENLRNLGLDAELLEKANEAAKNLAFDFNLDDMEECKNTEQDPPSRKDNGVQETVKMDEQRTSGESLIQLLQDCTDSAKGNKVVLEEDKTVSALTKRLSGISVSPAPSQLSTPALNHRGESNRSKNSLTESLLMETFRTDKNKNVCLPVMGGKDFTEKCSSLDTEEGADSSVSSGPGTPLLFGDEENQAEEKRAQAATKRLRNLSGNTPSPNLKKRIKCEIPPSTKSTEDSVAFKVLDVCSNPGVFEDFCQMLARPRTNLWAVALAFGSHYGNTTIGDGIFTEDRKTSVHGVALSEKLDSVYYVNLCQSCVYGSEEDERSFPCCTPHEDVSTEMKLEVMEKFLGNKQEKVTMWNAKHLLRILLSSCGNMALDCKLFCLETAQWMLSIDSKRRSLSETFKTYFPDDDFWKGLSKKDSGDSVTRVESCLRAVACLKLAGIIEKRLKLNNYLGLYWRVESKVLEAILRMETNGIGFDGKECQKLRNHLKQNMLELEKNAAKSAGREFAIGSPQEVSKVLFKELKLPPGGDFSTAKNCRTTRCYSTNKEILEKLSEIHCLPKVILEWRKVHNVLTTAVYPLMKEGTSGRICGTFHTFTVTGRVCMHDPNLQTMPKEFDVGDSKVCIRKLFVPRHGYVLLAADYSQLELRVLAHLSKDEKLLKILNSDSGDVFRIIAASWKGIRTEDVSDNQRQQAKQICYGIIYGMGANSLAEQLNVPLETAVEFMDSFKSQFIGVQRWILTVIADARENGFVQTLGGRRRYLSCISASTAAARSRAERQAVNSTVQGSAADLFKAALIKVNDSLKQRKDPMDAILVMQLHDEIIAEVKESAVVDVVSAIKRDMERCWNEFAPLRVILSVKIKIGASWGALFDYVIASE